MALISPDKKLAIEALVKDLQALIVADADHVILPLHITVLFDHLQITVREGAFSDEAIVSVLDQNSRTIWVEATEPYPRLVFATAHQLGHLLLHPKQTTDVVTRNQLLSGFGTLAAESEVELEADWFAAALLIPDTVFHHYWALTHKLDDLASIFGVPHSAIALRIIALGLQ